MYLISDQSRHDISSEFRFFLRWPRSFLWNRQIRLNKFDVLRRGVNISWIDPNLVWLHNMLTFTVHIVLTSMAIDCCILRYILILYTFEYIKLKISHVKTKEME